MVGGGVRGGWSERVVGVRGGWSEGYFIGVSNGINSIGVRRLFVCTHV